MKAPDDAGRAEADHPTSAATAQDLTPFLLRARQGFRREVAALIEALDRSSLLVPLARRVDQAPLGEPIAIEGELKLSPHLLPDPAGQPFAVLFSDRDLLEYVAQHLNWTTDGGPLEFGTLPARVGFELASELAVRGQVVALVINPGDEAELVLWPHELVSILQNQPLPLVAYVREISDDEAAKTLTSELDAPFPEALVQAVDDCQQAFPIVLRYEMSQQFNPERDREPHLTIVLEVAPGEVDRQAIESYLGERLEGKLPPPGYVDILFRRVEPVAD